MDLEVLEDAARIRLLPEVSIVIPLLNEADNLRPLYEALCVAMEQVGRSWEVVFIDDVVIAPRARLYEMPDQCGRQRSRRPASGRSGWR